jgi:hypothetical protein
VLGEDNRELSFFNNSVFKKLIYYYNCFKCTEREIKPFTHCTLKYYFIEKCAVLGYYAASNGNSLPTFWDNLQR